MRLINHITIDPTIQHTIKKTNNPAKMVRNGGPWAASLAFPPDFFPTESPLEGFEFDA